MPVFPYGLFHCQKHRDGSYFSFCVDTLFILPAYMQISGENCFQKSLFCNNTDYIMKNQWGKIIFYYFIFLECIGTMFSGYKRFSH